MKDDRGLFYYPFPSNKSVRMYIREEEGEICFRLFSDADPDLWKEHEWASFKAIQEASAMYEGKGKGFNPEEAYDVKLAGVLIEEDR